MMGRNMINEHKKNIKSIRWGRLTFIGVILLLSGCSNIGPKTVMRDRFNYNTAISNSWKQQTLLNIVKLRYADMPLFVEIASVVNGYSIESSVNIGGSLSDGSSEFFSLGGASKYTDRPTITYAPITGKKFNYSFMTPIPPAAIFFLMQSGYPVKMIVPLTVDAVNGLQSRIFAGANTRPGDPGFYRMIELLDKLQKSGNVGMRIVKGKGKNNISATKLFFYEKNLTPELSATFAEFNTLLGIQPEIREMTATYGLIPSQDNEIAMLTRSMLQIMIELSTQVDVPPIHVEENRTRPSLAANEDRANSFKRLIKINSSKIKPEHSFTAVNYEGYWFWIDDCDLSSKRVFTFLMILISMTESGGDSNLPIITIPAG